MKHLCWDSFFVGWLSTGLLGDLFVGRWGWAAIDFAVICFLGWAMDYRVKLRAEEKANRGA